jgi:Cys-rich protein (TIGR01571 family)
MGSSWEAGLCSFCCDGSCAHWAFAQICPCIVYAHNMATMKRKGIFSHIPTPDDYGLLPGLIHGIGLFDEQVFSLGFAGSSLHLCCLHRFMRCVTRQNIRHHYGIKGTFCEDCLSTVLCSSCTLIQESKQLQKESPTFLNSMMM